MLLDVELTPLGGSEVGEEPLATECTDSFGSECGVRIRKEEEGS